LDGISNTRILRKIRRCRAVRDRNHGGDKLDKRKNRAGFTLLEVMVVVVIIGLLATIVAPQLIGHHDDARVTKAAVDVSQIYDAAVMFKMKKGRWPDSIEEMIDGRPPSLRGYKTVPRDPWDNTFAPRPARRLWNGRCSRTVRTARKAARTTFRRTTSKVVDATRRGAMLLA